jgi:hypothetical protein
VPDILGLFAEVSGFADILMLGAGFILGLLYEPQQLNAALTHHISRVIHPSKSRNKKKKRDDDKHPLEIVDQTLLKSILVNFMQVSKLRLNAW